MMVNGKCYLIGAGECGRLTFVPQKGDLVIAADGGYQYLEEASIAADFVVGDFDSSEAPSDHPRVIRLKPEKDETDLYEAAMLGLERGYQKFEIYGGTGGRLDHTLANIQLLNDLANRGAHGVLVGNGYEMTVVKNGTLEFDASKKGRISVFSLREASYGVYLIGLKYPLTDYTMTNRFPIGVSNEFTGIPSSVSVRDGELLVISDLSDQTKTKSL